jgi:glycosyltransferase involved in cell wall biosynthesis
MFGPDLVNGSERHEYLLSKKLAELGVLVDILTTQTRQSSQTSAFSSAWPAEYPERVEILDGMRIERFPVSFSLSPKMGTILSRSMLRRWEREEQRFGTMLKGSRGMFDYYYRRAVERPIIYDFMMLLARGPHSVRLSARLLRTIRNYDVVLVGFVPFALTWHVLAAARILRRPAVLLALFHPDDLYHHFKAIYWCFNHADAILAQTSYSVELFAHRFPRSTPIAAGVGVDLAEFTGGEARGAAFRRRYGLERNKIVLLVGRKEYFKRYDLAIRAVELADDDRVRLVMIGRDVDGQPITSPRVTYLGEMPRQSVVDAYHACDVLMLPSESESFGWVLLEAWACGKPVIGNRRCAPVSAVISEGEDGYLCMDAAEMAQRIGQLTCRPDLAQRLGQAGFEKTAANYTWDVIGRKVADLYTRLAAARGRAAQR